MKNHAIGLAAALLLMVSTTSARGLTVKLGTLAPEGSPWHTVLRDIAEEWRSASNGKIKVRIYPGGVAGDEPDMVRKMRIGQLHAGAISGAGLARISQEIMALEMPMMLSSQEELDFVRHRMEPKIEASMAKQGFKLLTWGDAGWIYFFSQKPVVHPDDLKPLRIFAMAGETAHIDGWKASGYHPVPLAATDMHTALQSGLINVFTTTPVAALSFQWFGQAKHMTQLRWAPLVGAVMITTRIWRRIGEADRAMMLRTAKKGGGRLQKILPKLSSDAIGAMVKHGLEVHPVKPETAKEWERRARAGWPSSSRPSLPKSSPRMVTPSPSMVPPLVSTTPEAVASIVMLSAYTSRLSL